VRLLRQLNTTGITIAVVTHNRDLAAALPRWVELLDSRIRHDSGRAA
jgi:putative ABC transport system ATP-binding protein